MRHLLLFALLVLAAGCKKKPEPAPAPEPDPGVTPKKDDTPADTTAKDRAFWLAALKGTNPAAKDEAVGELVAWVETDTTPDTVNALLELLKDKTTNGAGKIQPARINSNREAAARVLAGTPKGEAALRDKGFNILRDGLNDSDVAVREHTAYTVGLLGSLGRPLSADVLKLCSFSDVNVRGAAFDALRQIGVTDPAALAALLADPRNDVARLAAELVAGLTEVPAAAVPALSDALKHDEPTVRVAAAIALTHAKANAAPAVANLVEAVKKHYPAEVTPAEVRRYQPGPDAAYWYALAGAGEPAAEPLAGLLTHTNPVVRMWAARTIAEIGAPAKAAAPKLRDALKSDVSIDAACALLRIGESKDEALALLKDAITQGRDAAPTAIDALPRAGDAGKELYPVALRQLTGENPAARFSAVGLLGSLPMEEAAKYAADLGLLAGDTGTGIDAGMKNTAAQAIKMRVGFVLQHLGPLGSPAAAGLAKALPTETDEGVRDQFIDALVAMGPGAKPALAALLPLAKGGATQSERRARLLVLIAVADPGSKEVSEALLAAADSTDQTVRVAAALGMAKLDPMPPAALARLVKMATTDGGTNARVGALRALAAAGPKAKPVRADVEKITTGKLPEFALLAKVALAAIDGDVKKSAADVRAGLTDRNAQVRNAAVISLVAIGPAASDLPALLKLLRDAGSTTKEAAAVCVAKLGPSAKDAVAPLTKLLGDTEGSVRAAAATALGEIGPAASAAVPKLRQLVGDGRFGDAVAGPAAAQALVKIGEKK